MVIVRSTGATHSDIAWAAGLFEGEGCVTKNGPRGTAVSMNMTDEDVVRKFHSVLGRGWVSGPYQPKNPIHKQHWHWKATSFEDVQYVSALLWTWLCSRRRAKVSNMLRWYAARPLTGKWLQACRQGHAFSNDNTGYSAGQRYCKTCKYARNSTYRTRKAQHA